MAVTRRLVLLSSLFLLSCIDGAKADTCKYGVTTINGDTPYYEMYKHCPSECCQSDCCGPPKPFSGGQRLRTARNTLGKHLFFVTADKMANARRLFSLVAVLLFSFIDGAKAVTCHYEVTSIMAASYTMYKSCPYDCCEHDCCGPPKPMSGSQIGLIVGLTLGLLALFGTPLGVACYIRRRRIKRLEKELIERLSRDLVGRLSRDLGNRAFVNPLGPGVFLVNRDTNVSSSSPSPDQPQSDHNVQSVTSPPGRDGDE